MPEKKPFNDFFLLGLSHLTEDELFLPTNRALQEIQKRLEFGKYAIREHTRKGDIIAFEAPEEWTFEHYKKIHETRTDKKITPEKEKELLVKWQNRDKAVADMYFELAQYAKSIGRKIVSLEPSLRKPGSALWLAYARELEGIPRKKRIEYIVRKKPDVFFIHKIQRHRPKMVVVSGGHAIFIEGKLKPAKVDYFPRINEVFRRMAFEKRLAEARLYRKRKMNRLRMRRARAAKRKPI